MKSNLMKKIIVFTLMAAVFISSSITSLAAESIGDNRGWIRAKLTYEFEDGVTGLSDDILHFTDGWSKTGDWYYYDKPVKPGDKVRFITGIDVPAEWTEELENKGFKVTVTVEASEVAPNASGWDKNTDVQYSESFDLWSAGYKTSDNVVIKKGGLTVDIHEYQLDENGKEVDYVNNKIVVPGQKVSKIVEFELGGKLGGNEKKPILEVIKTGEPTFLLMGALGFTLMTGGGYLASKKKKGGSGV